MTQSCKDVLEALIDTALSKAMKVGELTGSSASGSEIAAAKVELQSIRCAVIDSVEQQINEARQVGEKFGIEKAQKEFRAL